jgi:hypothetical protein
MIYQIIRTIIYAMTIAGTIWVLYSIAKFGNELLILRICYMKTKYFFLKQAVLCSQCECIFSYKEFRQCPACGTTNNFYVNLALKSYPKEGEVT